MTARALDTVAKACALGAVGLSLSGCGIQTACSAVGYLYDGPAVLEFSEPLSSTLRVAACLGAGCEPENLDRADGRLWEVAQNGAAMLEQGVVPGEVRIVRVTVLDDSDSVLSDAEYEIPISMEKTGVFGECPGPFSFDPVSVPLPN